MTMPDPGQLTSRGTRPFRRLRGPGLAVLVAWVAAGSSGSARTAHAQALPHAAANQLHASIANGDVEALRYWLTVRQADPNAASDQEPSVTPLGRCLALAAQILDAPTAERVPAIATPAGVAIGLRVLQDMVALLDERGARLSEADRQRFSAPVLRWYDDAVSRRAVTPASVQSTSARPPASESLPPSPASPPAASAAASPGTPATSAPAPVSPEPGPVTITPDPRKACNGTGHRVYLVNGTAMSITATVITVENAQGERSPRTRTDTYSVEPGNSWELGCDVSVGGGRVRWVLDRWK